MLKRSLIAIPLLAMVISASGCGLPGNISSGAQSQLSAYTELTAQPPLTEGSAIPIEIVPGVARSRLGYLVFPGLIKNNSDKWIAVQLLVKLYDSSGKELTATAATGNPLWASGLTFYIPPRGISPFMGRADEQDVNGKAVSYKLTIHKAVESQKPMQVQASDIQVELGEDFKVSGTLTNVGDETCPGPIAVGIGYASDGRVFVADFTSIEALAPEQSGSFKFSLGDYDTNELITKGEVLGGCWPDSIIE